MTCHPLPFARPASLLAAMLLIGQGALAQVTPGGTPPGAVPRPAPVESAPLAPPPGAAPADTGTPAPTAPAQNVQAPPAQAIAPATPTPAPPAAAAPVPNAPSLAKLPTLIEKPGDPVDVDDVTLPAKPTAVLSGASTWDDGFTNLVNAFRRIEQELTRAGLSPAGRPLTVFVETDDIGFRYQAMIPIPPAPTGLTSLGGDVRLGTTPSGKALRFVHKAAYEEIDDTYETITAYLDAKGIVVKDMFVEEYASDLTAADDPNLEVNVFVQPK